jgi:hypothetical protein
MTTDESKARAAELLRDEIALWMTSQVSPADVIAAACGVIVAGAESPAVVDLAGRSARESSGIIAKDVVAALDELRLPPRPRRSEAVLLAASLAMCRRFFRGLVSAGELARWAHRTAGHEGPAAVQGLVSLDDDYDGAEYDRAGVGAFAEIDGAVDREAALLVRSSKRTH